MVVNLLLVAISCCAIVAHRPPKHVLTTVNGVNTDEKPKVNEAVVAFRPSMHDLADPQVNDLNTDEKPKVDEEVEVQASENTPDSKTGVALAASALVEVQAVTSRKIVAKTYIGQFEQTSESITNILASIGKYTKAKVGRLASLFVQAGSQSQILLFAVDKNKDDFDQQDFVNLHHDIKAKRERFSVVEDGTNETEEIKMVKPMAGHEDLDVTHRFSRSANTAEAVPLATTIAVPPGNDDLLKDTVILKRDTLRIGSVDDLNLLEGALWAVTIEINTTPKNHDNLVTVFKEKFEALKEANKQVASAWQEPWIFQGGPQTSILVFLLFTQQGSRDRFAELAMRPEIIDGMTTKKWDRQVRVG